MASFTCVEPLSPTYSTLPRFNTLALLLFIILSPSASWATSGALAALMARTAVIALHAITLLAILTPSKDFETQDPLATLPAFDLDIIGTWIVLSAVGVAIPLLLGWAPALRESKARLLVKIWGCLVVIGGVCSYAAMRKSATVGVAYNSDDFRGTEIARNRCLNSSGSPLRTANAIVFDTERIFGRLDKGLISKFDIAALVPMSFAVLACLLRSKRKTRQSAYFALGKWLGRFVMGLAAVVLPAIIALHEIFLLANNPGVAAMPMTEGLRAFEQWSCWAATGLVVAATVLNWVAGETRSTQVTNVQLYEQQSGNDIEKSDSDDWHGILGKPIPAIVR